MISSAVKGIVPGQRAAKPAALPDWGSRVIWAVVRPIRIRRCRRALATLSDHTLNDIGIVRFEIAGLAEALIDGRTDATRRLRSTYVRQSGRDSGNREREA